MGIVRDAEGKTVGLLTLEDVLEEIVGDIEDEHDRPSQARLPIQSFPMSAIKKLQPPAGPTKS
jgi:CBS domain containing-hemolysin-like protein